MLNYQRIAQASLIGPGGMPLPIYNSAAYAEGLPAAYIPSVGPEQSHFYPNLVSDKFPFFEWLWSEDWQFSLNELDSNSNENLRYRYEPKHT